jgi:SAM-dependent methyltransferase
MDPGVGAIEGFFPATAMPDTDWWSVLWPEPSQVVAKLRVEPGSDVVDLCCGDGLFTAALARVARRVFAIDIDPRMLDLARAKVGVVGATNCVFVEGDAYEIATLVPWPADLVLIANTFHGVPDKERLGRGVAAVLKPNGRFVVVNWHRRPREETPVLGQPRGPKTEMRMEPENVAVAVERSGLRLESVVELPPYHYGAIFQKPPA